MKQNFNWENNWKNIYICNAFIGINGISITALQLQRYVKHYYYMMAIYYCLM